MEIITYVVSGAVAHQDSMGNSTVIHAGEVQVMSAGLGITHSENRIHLTEIGFIYFQIWIFPKNQNTVPRYQQRPITGRREKHNQFAHLVGPMGSEFALQMDQDAFILGGLFETGQSTQYAIQEKRHVLLHAVSGEATVNGTLLQSGDAALVSQEAALTIDILSDAELLLFDLA
jgi:redox-sensitive bicupin YhaK (pirin superfamily)